VHFPSNLALSGIGRVSCGSLVGAAEQPTANRLVVIKTRL